MDSPHKEIEVWWPDDAEEFSISSDERFIERYETVENLLGSNMPLPEKMMERHAHPVMAMDMLKEYEQQEDMEEWDGITDAFKPVRKMVEGGEALIPEELYENYRHVKAKVLSRVSLVRSKAPWAFFCLSAGSFETPRWLMLPRLSARPLHDLEDITRELRQRLGDEIDDVEMDETASDYLQRFIKQLSQAERSLLPRRKQRALDEMEYVLRKYAESAGKAGNQDRVDAYTDLLHAFTQPLPEYQPNWDEVASRWLDLIRPIWHEKLQSAKVKLLVLKDIRKDLISNENTLGVKIIKEFDEFPRQQKIDERIMACIIGVPN
jgi:hypothetical protein